MKPFAPLAAAATAAVALAAAPGAGAAVPQVACPAPPANDRAADAEAYAIAWLQQTSPVTVSCTDLTAAALPTLQATLQQAIAVSHQIHPAATSTAAPRASARSATRRARPAAHRRHHRAARHR